ncbi:unnamed protein product [Anisakis simplex]|uniref:DB domain-containing protein n=1 Tax=Anisakis simplex TaxID=6269 RepID=A0A0M3K817_ANISI|nr:unnamed protein product [Anisakis simplex]
MMDLVVIHGILLLAYFGTSQACMGLGGCGGGGGGGGGGIGGCSQCCARARGTKTHSGNPKQFGAVLRTDGNRPSTMVLIQLAIFICDLPLNMKLKNPNDDFLTCCKDAGLPSACLSKCSFSRYNKDTLRNMFFGLDACPIQAANDMHFCATKSMDHRECCARNGVGNTLAGDKCLIFCAPVRIF